MAPVSIPHSPPQQVTASRTPANVCAHCTERTHCSKLSRVLKAVQSRSCACRIANNVRNQTVKEIKWKALIADDEPAARRGVAQLLAAFPDFAIAGECRNGAEVLAALDTATADVLFSIFRCPALTVLK